MLRRMILDCKKKFIPRRFQNLTEPFILFLKRNLSPGLGCDMLHLDKNASAKIRYQELLLKWYPTNGVVRVKITRGYGI